MLMKRRRKRKREKTNKEKSQHAGEKRGVAGLLLGRTERAATALLSSRDAALLEPPEQPQG